MISMNKRQLEAAKAFGADVSGLTPEDKPKTQAATITPETMEKALTVAFELQLAEKDKEIAKHKSTIAYMARTINEYQMEKAKDKKLADAIALVRKAIHE